MDRIESDGRVTNLQTLREKYARNSRGEIYQEWTQIDPQTGEAVREPWFSVLSSGQPMVTIDPNRKLALIEKNPVADPVASFGPRKWPDNYSRRQMLGKTCVVLPIRGAGGSGEMCVEEEGGFFLFKRLTIATAEGTQVRTSIAEEVVTELEPDPALFASPQIPEGYRIETAN